MLFQTKAKVTIEMILLTQAGDAEEVLIHLNPTLESVIDCAICSLSDDNIAACLPVAPYTEQDDCTEIAKIELDPPVESSLDPELYGFDIEDEDEDDEDDDVEEAEEAPVVQDNKPKT